MGLIVRGLDNGFATIQQVYWRGIAAFSIGFLLFFRDIDFKKLLKIKKNEWFLFFYRNFLTYVLGVVFFTKAIITTKLANVVLIGILPFGALWGAVIFKEKLNLKRILYILGAFIGAALIVIKDFSSSFVFGKGEIYALISIVFYSLGTILRKKHSNLLNDKEITVLNFVFGFVFVFAASMISKEPLSANWSMNLFWVLILAGCYNVAMTYLLNYGYKRIEAVVATNILSLEGVFGILIGLLFFLEVPTIKELIGGVLIITCAYLMNKDFS